MISTIWRIAVLVVNVLCILLLLNRYRLYNKSWKKETFDYWWTLLLWSIAGVSITIQGLASHRKATVALLFISIASLATPIGLYRKALDRKHET